MTMGELSKGPGDGDGADGTDGNRAQGVGAEGQEQSTHREVTYLQLGSESRHVRMREAV